jgi:hypothetical protein
LKQYRVIGNSRDREAAIGAVSELSVRTDVMCVCRLGQRTGLQGNVPELKETVPGINGAIDARFEATAEQGVGRAMEEPRSGRMAQTGT